MNKENLTSRIMQFVIRIVKIAANLPATEVSGFISEQVVRSAAMIGVNYQAACRSASKKEFIDSLRIAEQKTGETIMWLELIEGSSLLKPERIGNLHKESEELLAIFAASIKTAGKSAKEKPKSSASVAKQA